MTTIWMKRLAAGAMLTAAPALFAIGAAGASNAATGSADNGANMSTPTHHVAFPGQNSNTPASRPDHGANMNRPPHHDAFPGQNFTDAPGSRTHHHHQWHRHG